jgi:hypothetical protein
MFLAKSQGSQRTNILTPELLGELCALAKNLVSSRRFGVSAVDIAAIIDSSQGRSLAG